MEPLRDDWSGARAAATQAAEAGDKEAARKIVETFHTRLAQTKVLDPACGTGNFLYVAMARMKELEGEVLELLEELGDDQYLAEISGHTITPENFLGIEINPRAANIAQLVLWIGYLQWHFRVNGEDRMPEAPVLRDVKTIENRDALITWDKRELERDQYGRPVTRWDGETMKKHPVTGKDVPDEAARVEVYRYVNPKAARWPKADFIIGNPPFIGDKRMRDRLGDAYISALRRSYAKVPKSVDFVMYWWAKASRLLRSGATRRFGLITTNSIVQSFNARLVKAEIENVQPISIVFAIADHPWRDIETDAAVRVAMTVGERGHRRGRILTIACQNTDVPDEFHEEFGVVGPSLDSGARSTATSLLKANGRLAYTGMYPLGEGFIIDPEKRPDVDLQSRFLKPFRTARDLTQSPRSLLIIDFFPLSEAESRAASPSLFQWAYHHVKPERDVNPVVERRRNWWLFTRPIPELRKSLMALDRFIAVPRTAKHFTFQFVTSDVIVDTTVVAITTSDAVTLGILSSRIHLVWAYKTGGRLEDRPRYQHESTFKPFPFPDTTDEALKDRIRDAAEKLDALRKDVLARHYDLTLTKLYNVLEALRAAEKAGTVLSDKDRDIATRGCVSLIRQYHDTIDAAVAEAYGWPADLTDEEILERLVALNKERAAEEAKGIVRWLRPEFQAPGYAAPKEQKTLALPEAAKPTADILEWPTALPEQFTAVAAVVDRAARPIAANDVARAFKNKRTTSVAPVLDTLAGMGRLRKLEDGRYAA
jgi:hypothetical protein